MLCCVLFSGSAPACTLRFFAKWCTTILLPRSLVCVCLLVSLSLSHTHLFLSLFLLSGLVVEMWLTCFWIRYSTFKMLLRCYQRRDQTQLQIVPETKIHWPDTCHNCFVCSLFTKFFAFSEAYGQGQRQGRLIMHVDEFRSNLSCRGTFTRLHNNYIRH